MTLWTSRQIADATGGDVSSDFKVSGLSIDTRSLQPGDLFVALKDVRDGHDFIEAAIAAGAGGVLCERSPENVKAVTVPSSEKALEDLGVYARQSRKALRIGVTGSVGKTSVKDALAVMFGAFGSTHKSIKSFNNHYGVPITLATIPEAAEYAVLEMGMNHAGEMSALSKLAKPEIALINNIAGAHLAYFDDVQGIADAKAEIIDGMEAGSALILNGDNKYTPHIRQKATSAGLRILTFGHSEADDVYIKSSSSRADGGDLTCWINGEDVTIKLNVTGEHWFMNAAACLAVAKAAELDISKAAAALQNIVPAPGRGDVYSLEIDGKSITLIDESYNANPTSMRAAFSAAALRSGRKIALLGDMFELGADELELHRDLAEPLVEAGWESGGATKGGGLKCSMNGLRHWEINSSYLICLTTLPFVLVGR